MYTSVLRCKQFHSKLHAYAQVFVLRQDHNKRK